jgi:hypothetical protein
MDPTPNPTPPADPKDSARKQKMANANPDQNATPGIHYENELYQLHLGNDFKMKMQNIKTKVYKCPLSWWKSQLTDSRLLKGLQSSILQSLLQNPPQLSASGAELQESSLSKEI